MIRIVEEKTFWNEFALQPDIEAAIADPNIPVNKVLREITNNQEIGKNILEIGSGTGRLAIEMAKLFPDSKVTGIDISIEMVKIATKKAKSLKLKNITFEETDGRSIPFTNKFTFIYSFTCFQHIDEEGVKAYITEAARMLRKGGIFRFQYGEGTARSAFSQNYEYTDIKKWCEEAGLEIESFDLNTVLPNWTWITCIKK